MIVDAPHSIARAFLGMKALETFLPRYVELINRTVVELHNSAERLKMDDKETRDGALGSLLTKVNSLVLGEDPDTITQWPLVTLTPMHVGLAYRSQMLYLLSRTEINVHHILSFINLVYFPSLNLTELNESILRYGDRTDQNSKRYQHMLVLLVHQVAMQASYGELMLPEETSVETSAEGAE